jgi:hypothetical protein
VVTVLYNAPGRFPGPDRDGIPGDGQPRMPLFRGPGTGPHGTYPPGAVPVNPGDCCLTLRGWPSGALDPSALPPEDT